MYNYGALYFLLCDTLHTHTHVEWFVVGWRMMWDCLCGFGLLTVLQDFCQLVISHFDFLIGFWFHFWFSSFLYPLDFLGILPWFDFWFLVNFCSFAPTLLGGDQATTLDFRPSHLSFLFWKFLISEHINHLVKAILVDLFVQVGAVPKTRNPRRNPNFNGVQSFSLRSRYGTTEYWSSYFPFNIFVTRKTHETVKFLQNQIFLKSLVIW